MCEQLNVDTSQFMPVGLLINLPGYCWLHVNLVMVMFLCTLLTLLLQEHVLIEVLEWQGHILGAGESGIQRSMNMTRFTCSQQSAAISMPPRHNACAMSCPSKGAHTCRLYNHLWLALAQDMLHVLRRFRHRPAGSGRLLQP